MRAEAIPIKSWVELETAFLTVKDLPRGLPRMVLVHGDPGLGKTTAVDTLHLRHGGIYTVASSTWSQRSMMQKFAGRLGVQIRKSDRIADLLDKVLTVLEQNRDKMIVIDEFDRITHKPALVELVREIYDTSDVPIVMVGMGSIDQSLRDIPQFPQRIGQRVEFEKLDLEDATSVVSSLTDITLTDDLTKHLWNKSQGIIRLLVTEVAKAEAIAKRDGLESIGISDLEAEQ